MDVTKTESDVKTEPNAVKAEGENKRPKLEDQASQGSSEEKPASVGDVSANASVSTPKPVITCRRRRSLGRRGTPMPARPSSSGCISASGGSLSPSEVDSDGGASHPCCCRWHLLQA